MEPVNIVLRKNYMSVNSDISVLHQHRLQQIANCIVINMLSEY